MQMEGHAMHIQSLGHAVVKVRNLKRSEQFYNGVLGMPIINRTERMTFFSFGNHHDFAIAEVGKEAPQPEQNEIGLAHLAFCLGRDFEDLRAAKAQLDTQGIATRPIEHGKTYSLYLADPDGNGIELYVDRYDDWRDSPVQEPMSAPLAM
jgi:catechol 2,3-dioxygenase